ncbi:hypothetical protein HDC92_005034 [Pedobacter sp. AK017]|uniref:JAB domain-containing protein n=1 Tax=Pedobacter sp. AK017 TaxID=2723073 RepID=UPI001621EAB7|nr:JAB domain-containing protein [Pedobacter sp. AK017]MBB5441326.1 hypothetical protein [Pedobacter sp. AK017]
MYTSITPTAYLLHDTENFYYRSKNSLNRQYIPGNSYHTCKMAKEVIGPGQSGYWLMLFDGSGTLKHTQKMGAAGEGFGEIKNLLQTALQHQCLSMVLVSYTDGYYQANSTDLLYNIRLITAAYGISMVLLDHIVIEFDGYYSYRDNGLLTYLEN